MHIKAKNFPEGRRERRKRFIHDRRIMKDEYGICRRFKRLNQPLDLLRQPDVILIGQDDDVARGLLDRLLKISPNAEVLPVDTDLMRNARCA